MRRGVIASGAAAFAACAVFCSAAAAQGDTWSGGFNEKPATRRSDFAIGFGGGLLAGDARGYPNEIDKLDNPAYFADTGLGAGTGGSLWFGGALKDWFTVGLGFSGGSFTGRGLKASGGAFILHIETFPLFYRGGVWRDLGLFADFGAGSLSVKRGNDTVVAGGSMSVVGLGALWEVWHFGHFAAGPILEVQRLFSPSATQDSALGGMRIAYYGGP